MKTTNNRSGFTLLELIIVIIIVGVLASLALPRFFATVEYSRSTEALSAFSAVRGSAERCYMIQGSFANCTDFSNLDIEDPANSPGNHFTYSMGGTGSTFQITATRNTLDTATGGDTISLTQTATTVTKTGDGAFQGLK